MWSILWQSVQEEKARGVTNSTHEGGGESLAEEMTFKKAVNK